MPKDYEDSAIFARTLFNHVERQKSRVGLKEIAGFRYGAWGLSEDMFDVSQMYEPTMLQYAATDACATMFVFNRMQESVLPNLESVRSTAENYSPWDQLATFPSPMEHIPEEGYFYHNTGKFLVRDAVRLMMNGLPASLEKVQELEQDLDKILEDVHSALATNPYVKRYLEAKNKELLDLYLDTQRGKCKEVEDFLEEFKASSPVHRSYYMELFAERMGIEFPEEKHPTGVSKWSARLVKKLSASYPALKPLVDKTVDPNSPTAVEAMKNLANDKCRMYNANYLALIETPKLKPLVFNPGSPKQKQEIFAMAGLESDAKSATTGEDSWCREQVERVNEETEDEDMRSFTQLLIDYSFAAIIKSTFVPAFYRYSLDEVLYGTYTLFGAKSMRFTSSSPNMLNMPSSASRFAKPIKQCFTAPEGFVIGAIDFAALEDRVMANLSKDENKLNIFLKGVDGHSLAAYFYWPEEASQEIENRRDATEAALEFKRKFDDGNEVLKELRSRGKRISFGLAYGAFPKKVSVSAKIPLEEAESIFKAYHEELYPGVTAYRENYVLKSARENGFIHMGLGARIYTDSPDKDIRTLTNSTCQFWSILSLLTINKLHQLIDEAGYQNDIIITSSIYDSIYFCIRDDAEIIKWLNDVIVPVMETKYMQGQILDNSVDLEIGPDWSELYKLPHNASVEEVSVIRSKW